jgi:hypothetical protein
VIAPKWTGKVWHHALIEMAVEELTVSPRDNFFRPSQRAGRGVLGMPHWPVNVFRIIFRHGFTFSVEPFAQR